MRESAKEKAFKELFKTHYNGLYYYALSLLGDQEEARDAVNDVFARLWTNFSPGQTAITSAFLRQCVRNHCLDLIKHAKVISDYARLCMELYKHQSCLEEDPEEYLPLINSTLEKMPARTRFVLEQCYYENKSYAEVAEIMGITASGVKQHMMKALKMLRDTFSSKYGKP